MEAEIDGEKIHHIERFRVQSGVFDLRLKKGNVYHFAAGITKSVCDGYWLFIKPLEKGKHIICFKGETLLDEPFTKNLMTTNIAYHKIKQHIRRKSTFILQVRYDLMIDDF
jgi:hypothetical protein